MHILWTFFYAIVFIHSHLISYFSPVGVFLLKMGVRPRRTLLSIRVLDDFVRYLDSASFRDGLL